jgi:SAM-dependent methyltransferase
MDYAGYLALRKSLAPGLRYNQQHYSEVLDAAITPATLWLDAGCGHLVIPHYPQIGKGLVARARRTVGVDLDERALRHHEAITKVAVTDLEALPFKDESFTLVTANMVVEHLARPAPVFSEFARVLTRGGQLLLHTPNAWSYFVLVARFLPDAVIRWLDERPPEDIFPAHYRANTPRRLTRLLGAAGFQKITCRLLSSDAILQRSWLLCAVELLWIRATMTRLGKVFRVSMLVTASR